VDVEVVELEVVDVEDGGAVTEIDTVLEVAAA